MVDRAEGAPPTPASLQSPYSLPRVLYPTALSKNLGDGHAGGQHAQ